MARLTREWIEAQRARSEQTWIAITASGVIILAHPGQKPEEDPKILREHFGIMPGTPIGREADFPEHRPPFEKWERELKLQDLALDDQIEAHERDLVALRAQKAAAEGRVPEPPAKTARRPVHSEA